MLNLLILQKDYRLLHQFDVSFISLNLILPALAKILVDGGQVVALVKPQFEAGVNKLGKTGLSVRAVSMKKC